MAKKERTDELDDIIKNVEEEAKKAKSEADANVNNEADADELEDVDDDDDDDDVERVNDDEEKSFAQICRDILKDKNNKRWNGLVIKRISFDEKANYTQVNVTLNKKIPSTSQYAVDGKHKTLYTNTFAIASVIRELPFAWLASHVIDEPECMEQILTGATIDIIQVFTPENEEFVNPFSTKANPDVYVSEEDTIRDFIVNIKLSNMGMGYLMEYARDLRNERRRQKQMNAMMMSM